MNQIKSRTIPSPKTTQFDKVSVQINKDGIGQCQVCGKKAIIEKVKGYEAFLMCPHCAYSTKIHASGEDSDYC